MKKTTTEITIEYIKNHPSIKSCLKQGLINYSSLARLISKELKIEKKSSQEAILIAARRFQEKLKKEVYQEKKVRELLSTSELEVKNKVVVYIIEKNIDFELIEKIQKKIRKEPGVFYLIEGSVSYTIITQNRFVELFEKKFQIIKKNKDLVLINLKSTKEIEETVGVISYLTSLFAENGINLVEVISCWADSFFIIEEKDLNKAFQFLNF